MFKGNDRFTLLLVLVCSTLIGWSQEDQSSTTKIPTKPVETEVWEPVPKKVAVAANTNIPSDAIVLFDGTNFDQWVQSKDKSKVQWILNKDGSMTVKTDLEIFKPSSLLEVFNYTLNGKIQKSRD